ncbi:MAG: DUF4880 domain-containing protein, partial [Rhizobiaceae bacterium]|nr:DUF4880 domain-containing protein [Rhizobiaceae bacterium]
MIEHDDQAASLLEEATDWLIARQAAPDDAVLAGDLDTWLARSAAHRAAFARAERAWVLLGKACPRTIPAGD